jgi:large subunit ribosomal protein L25
MATTRPRLTAERRTRTGKKSELRALRREGLVPGTLYGHGDPEMIRIPARALGDYLRHHQPGGLLDVDLEGTICPAIIREIDRHAVTGSVINLGLQRVDMQASLRAAIALQFVGEEELIRNDLILQRQMDEIEVTGRADLLPEAIVVDVTTAENGTIIRIADLPIPEGLLPSKDLDLPVAIVSVPAVSAEAEAVLEAEEAAAEETAGAEETAAEEAAPAEG